MKLFHVCIITFVLVMPFDGGRADTVEGTTPEQPGTIKAAPQVLIPQKKEQTKKTGKEPWPRTFVTTEKITADSVVSFPADI